MRQRTCVVHDGDDLCQRHVALFACAPKKENEQESKRRPPVRTGDKGRTQRRVGSQRQALGLERRNEFGATLVGAAMGVRATAAPFVNVLQLPAIDAATRRKMKNRRQRTRPVDAPVEAKGRRRHARMGGVAGGVGRRRAGGQRAPVKTHHVFEQRPSVLDLIALQTTGKVTCV